jgi:hypothetical protein
MVIDATEHAFAYVSLLAAWFVFNPDRKDHKALEKKDN